MDDEVGEVAGGASYSIGSTEVPPPSASLNFSEGGKGCPVKVANGSNGDDETRVG